MPSGLLDRKQGSATIRTDRRTSSDNVRQPVGPLDLISRRRQRPQEPAQAVEPVEPVRSAFELDQQVAAGLTSTATGRLGATPHRSTSLKWQKDLRTFTSTGEAGFLLEYLAIKQGIAQIIFRAGVTIEQESSSGSGGFMRVEDPALAATATAWRSSNMSFDVQAALLVRHLARTGEVYQQAYDDPATGQLRYRLVSETQIVKKTATTWTISDRESPTRDELEEHPAAGFRRLWVPDEDYPGEAWTPLKPGLPHVRRWLSHVQADDRRNEVPNLLTKMVVFDPDPTAVVRDEEGGERDLLIEEIMASQHMAYEAINAGGSHDLARGALPVRASGGRVIDLADKLDPNALTKLDWIHAQWAHTTDMPVHILMAGQGTSNHWGDYLLDEVLKEQSVFPAVAQALDLITQNAWRPMLAAAERKGRIKLPAPVEQLRLGYRPEAVDRANLTPELILEAWRSGLLKPETAAEMLRLPSGSLLEPPADVSDWDRWLSALASKNLSTTTSDAIVGAEVTEPARAALPAPTPWW